MILSLLPVSKRKLPLGCMTTKKPTGTVIGLLDAPDCNALFAIVKPPELNAYIFIPAGAGPWARDSEVVATSRKTKVAEIRPSLDRLMTPLLNESGRSTALTSHEQRGLILGAHLGGVKQGDLLIVSNHFTSVRAPLTERSRTGSAACRFARRSRRRGRSPDRRR